MATQSPSTGPESDPLLGRHRGAAVDQTQDGQDEDSGEVGQADISDSLPKLGATAFDFLTGGIAMAAIGVLIPDIEKFYDIDDTTVAFIFPAGMLGYLLATATVQTITLRFGLRAIAIVSPLIRLVAALVLMIPPPFGTLLITYACFGYGAGLTDTAWNAWASRISRPNVAQGLLHGSFSLGCVLGPVIAVAMLRSYAWNTFYSVIALCSCIELFAQGWAFRNDTASKHNQRIPGEIDLADSPGLLRNRTLWVCGAFYFLYQGVEASFTDWIVVYMRRARKMDASTAGYSSSIFWIGMAAGRYALGPISERFGVGRSVTTYIAIALCSQIGLGLVRSTVATFIFLALNGFLIAPLFPSGIVVLVSRVAPSSQLTVVATAIAIGQLGAAAAPLGVGLMATKLGMHHLIEVIFGLSISMLIAWAAFIQIR